MIEQMTLYFVVGQPGASLPGSGEPGYTLPVAGDEVPVFTPTAEYIVHIRSVLDVSPPLDGIVTLTVLAERERASDDYSAKLSHS